MIVSGTTVRRALTGALTLAALTACAGWTTPAMRGEPTPVQRDSARVAAFRAEQAALKAGTWSAPASALTFALARPSRGDAILFGNGIATSGYTHRDGVLNASDAMFLTQPGRPNGLAAVYGVGNVVVHQGTAVVPSSKGP